MSNYLCQRCKLPLVLDQSLEGLSNAQKHLLTVNYTQRPPVENTSLALTSSTNSKGSMKSIEHSKDEYPVISDERKRLFKEVLSSNGTKPLIGSRGISDSINADEGSFVILEDKSRNMELDKIPMSDRVSSLQSIFNIISSKYEIDYPVCSDCANTLIGELKVKFDELTKEKDIYAQFLKKLIGQSGPNSMKAKESLFELEKLKAEEKSLLEQLEMSEKEGEDLTKQIVDMEQELEKMNLEEKLLCDQRNKADLEMMVQVNELQRVQSLYESDLNQLDALRKISVFNDVFAISHDGLFGTINGLRLDWSQ
ncbi:unnamed protein product [Ambrosiozyma monospora]|uniref:Unnamed protein product n=1 Tax=Ambrosiozyma monospora TaxID=43982 RepID=A0A9W6Z3K6_AMBMO|nr:unnamed protein product [Ambrosiozyma monospora]